MLPVADCIGGHPLQLDKSNPWSLAMRRKSKCLDVGGAYGRHLAHLCRSAPCTRLGRCDLIRPGHGVLKCRLMLPFILLERDVSNRQSISAGSMSVHEVPGLSGGPRRRLAGLGGLGWLWRLVRRLLRPISQRGVIRIGPSSLKVSSTGLYGTSPNSPAGRS